MFGLYAVAFGASEIYGYDKCIERRNTLPDLVVYQPDCVALYAVCKSRIPAHSEMEGGQWPQKDRLKRWPLVPNEVYGLMYCSTLYDRESLEHWYAAAVPNSYGAGPLAIPTTGLLDLATPIADDSP
jgi:hypothetical protein